MHIIKSFLLLTMLALTACDQRVLNSPYPVEQAEESILFTSFQLRPKHLDPGRSYSANEIAITAQIYEPPLQYHYLKRPYELEGLTAKQLPEVRVYDAEGTELPADTNSELVDHSIYTIRIQEGIAYQPHPAFVRDGNGEFRYHQLSESELEEIENLADFEHTASRELKAQDYIYQIKRLAHPDTHSPILGVMAEHIVGLRELSKQINDDRAAGEEKDLRDYRLSGVKQVDEYTYQIKVNGNYPQLRYWLAMPFFAPIPWEAMEFYQQPGLIKKNITLDWYPVGTGPYYLTENDPNRRMVLSRNPNFHGETYPETGESGDEAAGLLADAGKAMPFIDKIVFTLEKENTSYWSKFIQGYYDVSGISSDSFEQAIDVSSSGEFGLSDGMKEKGIQLETEVATSSYYMGFNMLDSTVGGYTESARKLRRAIAIAVDQEEYISIFANGRGIPAQGPLPPGMFGYRDGEAGTDEYVYEWREGGHRTRPIEDARQLLAEAGYPGGRDLLTGEPLVLNFDVPARGPDSKAQLDWMRKQFDKLNIQLVIRATDYNRFQDKIRQGQAQIFQSGWNADYPDPENFLFLLYGPNSKSVSGGENAANYQNEEFDKLFEQMRVMPNNAKRQQIIDEMVSIARRDAPWVWGFHPKNFTLFHAWNKNVKSHLMANNTLKYRRLDTDLRAELQSEWNKPLIWPLFVVIGLILLALMPAAISYFRRKYQSPAS